MFDFNEELLLGAFVWFAEDGTTIDAETIAIDNQPDDSPAANWTDREFGDIERVKITKQTKNSPRSKPRPTGGYNDNPKVITTGWVIEMTTSLYNELVHRQALGAAAAIADGVAFTPFQMGGDQKIEGWLRIEAKDELGNTKVNIIEWVEFRLSEIPEWKNEYGKPVLQFTILGDENGGLSTCVVNEAA